MIIVGTSGGARDAMAALAVDGRLAGACPQERVTRVRGAGVGASGLPDEAIDLLLQRHGRTRADVGRYLTVDGRGPAAADDTLARPRAHACTAWLTSPFPDAAIVVCDHERPGLSVWTGRGAVISHAWTWPEARLTDVLLRATAALGLEGPGGVRRTEALARLRPSERDAGIDALIQHQADGRLVVDARFEAAVAERTAGRRELDSPERVRLSAAIQARVAEILVEWLREVRARTGLSRLCLGGSLFHLSQVNSLVRTSGVFDEVFVPVEPGESGLAVGVVLDALGSGPAATSPFLGPAYSAQEIKDVLDNCKLHYSWESEEAAVQVAVGALREGRLVGWFDGAMEWGPRALGARSILASPTAPYVLENLNRFLKHREPWRGYALSGLEHAVGQHFDGPATAPFMECDFRPKDPHAFRHVLPSPDAAIRVQTVGAEAPWRFRRLLEAMGEATGLPFLVNTSFNGFHEPIVCRPRDAVRVVYGTGVDVLIIDQFVLRK